MWKKRLLVVNTFLYSVMDFYVGDFLKHHQYIFSSAPLACQVNANQMHPQTTLTPHSFQVLDTQSVVSSFQ